MAPGRPLNPFALPGWDSTPLRPLRPWQRPVHREYYVDLANMEAAYTEFQIELSDLSGVLEDGRLVLVTGAPGTGKTALINRCVDWTAKVAGDRGLRSVIVDLSGSLPEDLELSLEDRASQVSDHLFGLLVDEEALRPAAEAQLARDRDVARRFLPRLGNALHPEVLLQVLLPSPNELVDEVIRYARVFSSPKVLYYTESSYLEPDDVADIVRRLETWVPPVTLSLQPLGPGDVERFVRDRLARHHGDRVLGISEGMLDLLASLAQTVAMLQRMLHGVYEERSRSGLQEGDLLTVEDMRAFLNGKQRHSLP
ncbi:hypothetical protein [Saccharothrix stipae]